MQERKKNDRRQQVITVENDRRTINRRQIDKLGQKLYYASLISSLITIIILGILVFIH